MSTQPTEQLPDTPAPEPPSHAPEGGLQLLLGDAWTTMILVNAVRKRAIVRAFGVPPEDVNAITVIGLALIAGSVHQSWERLKPSPPSRGDSLLAVGTARAVLGNIIGPDVDAMPGMAGLIALALVAHAARPTVTRSVHAVRAEWHRFALGFHQRYGPPAKRAAI